MPCGAGPGAQSVIIGPNIEDRRWLFLRQAHSESGLISNRSIAYGIAKAKHREGATLAFTYQSERCASVSPAGADSTATSSSRWTSPKTSRSPPCSKRSAPSWGGLAAWCIPRLRAQRALEGDFLTASRARHFASARRFGLQLRAGQGARSLLRERKGCLLALTFWRRAHHANYNVMGLAKAIPSKRRGANLAACSALRAQGQCDFPDDQDAGRRRHRAFQQVLASNTHHAPLRAMSQRGRRQCRRLSVLGTRRGNDREIMYVDAGFNTTAQGNADVAVEPPASRRDLPRTLAHG